MSRLFRKRALDLKSSLHEHETISAELFGKERFSQHAHSLAQTQVVTDDPIRVYSFIDRLDANSATLRRNYEDVLSAVEAGKSVTPAAEWLIDNYHLVEQHVHQTRADLPTGFYRQLPKLADGHLAGHPRIFGVVWAYVAHTDSHFDPGSFSDFINACQKPFWLLNTSRGKNVVTADLVEALKTGKILGAGLDVIEYENLSFETLHSAALPEAYQYLLQSKNVLLTPHIAGWTVESQQRLAQVIVDKIKEKYFGVTTLIAEENRVTGIGGVFFKSANPKELVAWYGKHLGLKTDDYGSTFWWKDKNGNDCSTQWSPFKDDTTYFQPSDKQFMQNFRVSNLGVLLRNLAAEGVTIVGEMETYDYGKFGWILDPEGNKIELWEPIDSVFQ